MRAEFNQPFTYGAVYFRKSNPPEADWERDYRTAAQDGMNTFRHWFLWSAIEIAPNQFDWADYDRQLDLAAENGIQTIVAEMITAAPEWAFRRFAHARLETRDGHKLDSSMSGSCVTGGFPGLCLDHDDYRALAERFLCELVARYKDHPGLGGYDIWNECTYWSDVCYCPATAEAFRAWLKARYGDLRSLGQAWHRHSLAEWEDVTPPRQQGPYPDTLDWLQFRIDNAYRWMRWRVQLIRSIDGEHPITAHGVAGSLTRMASHAADDWRAAAEVDSYGYTWGSCRHGDEPWKQFHAVDLVRASVRGKSFWHAEAYAGPLWMQSNVVGKPRDEGRIASPEDIRYWDLVSCMLGATGILYLRWRPLLDGPLFGAFGPYGLDGSRTPRSEMVSRIARWVNAPAQARLWQSRPIQGEVGIVYVPETQLFAYAQQGHTDTYARSLQGAYQGFFDCNIQADWVHIDRLAAGDGGADTPHPSDGVYPHDLLYLPYPVMLTQETADRLKAWVAGGGTLIAEGCPGYFGDRGHVGTAQPNLGLDELFGVRESTVEFTPDLLGDLVFRLGELPVWGGLFLQTYQPTTGTPVGWVEDGQVVVVDHTFGQGKTRLIGTMAGAGYAAHPDNRSSAFFADLLRFAGKTQHMTCGDPQVKARLHAGAGGTYLWVANPTRRSRPVCLTLSENWGPFSSARTLWGDDGETRLRVKVDQRTITLTVGARNVAVCELLEGVEGEPCQK